ncbi:MAG: L-rhamnose isomerase [Candidatus Methylacidiphilales bacterium]|nr:L-rhamnose isomerase [Candidatus Methylacidiphilales bacterium]
MTAFDLARETYAAQGVDVEKALQILPTVPISLHCWQGDDVGGFEKETTSKAGGGTLVTGNYLGRARTLEELQQDLDFTFTLIPGSHRLNLHACYGDFRGRKADRNTIDIGHFQGWVDWCKSRGLGVDFNPTFFAHPKADEGFTLSHADAGIRQFWIDHGIACRKVAEQIGRELGKTVITNFWIPDGYKDTPYDRKGPRDRLEASLDAVFKPAIDPAFNRDAIECKLFGIGSESYVVGSHEFYLGYAVKNQKIVCLDAGHFHPTESLADKISSVLQFVPELLLHVSRGVRWDSDHVVLMDDPTKAIAEEIVRGGFLARTHIGLDFFDASINRTAAWAIGTRNAMKCLLLALLEPSAELRRIEAEGDWTSRLALLEEIKTLPFGEVWDEYCRRQNAPVGRQWLKEVKAYEDNVLSRRN